MTAEDGRIYHARKKKMTDPDRPTIQEVEAAARVLFKEGQLHHWWRNFTKTYDELAATDPIGKDEFDGIVERVLIAARNA
jgi:hypothetical protein